MKARTLQVENLLVAKPRPDQAVNQGVPKVFTTLQMMTIAVVAALAVLALITQAGVLVLQRSFPAQGRMVEVAGATLHVVELGPRDAAGPPIVMIHGASSNLEAMRLLGERLAASHRVIL